MIRYCHRFDKTSKMIYPNLNLILHFVFSFFGLFTSQDNLPPEIKARLRQPGGREKLMKEMAEGKIPPGMEGMTGGIPGLGGGGLGGLGGLMQGLMGGGGGGGELIFPNR